MWISQAAAHGTFSFPNGFYQIMYDFNAVRPQIEALCKKAGVTKLMAFGSAVREDFTSSSDIDLVYSAPDTMGLQDKGRFLQELERVFNRKVDLLTENGLRGMTNPFRKKTILEDLTTIYAS